MIDPIPTSLTRQGKFSDRLAMITPCKSLPGLTARDLFKRLAMAGLALAGTALSLAYLRQDAHPNLLQPLKNGGGRMLPAGTRVGCEDQPDLPPCPSSIKPLWRLRGDLSMCVIVRDELDMDDWVAHHQALGVDSIYIYDDNSTRPLTTALKKKFKAGGIHYQFFNTRYGELNRKNAVYNECIDRFSSQHKFMAFIDADEYIVPIQGNPNLRSFLAEFSHAAAVTLNVRQFGSSGHIVRPTGRVVDQYRQCFAVDNEMNRLVKVIANTLFLERFDIHNLPVYKLGSFAVNEKGQPSGGPRSEKIDMSRWAINHYPIKSREHFYNEQLRGPAQPGHDKTLEFFQGVDGEATEICPEVLPLAAAPGRPGRRLKA